jgi:Ca2+-binding RTX toxin-like protein
MQTEFLINTYENNWQRDAHITTLRDGGFIVVYESYINDYDDGPSATVVVSQRYDSSGRRVGGETIVDGEDGTKADNARVTTLSDGGYVVVWSWDDYDDILTLKEEVYARVYNADGTARTEAIRVDSIPLNDALLPEVYATANGGFNVVFGADRSTTLFDQIYSQKFTADGTKLGGNTLVNTIEGQFDELYARSATLISGATITIWNGEGAFTGPNGNSSNQVRGTLTNAAGDVVRGDFGLAINYGSPGLGSGAGYDVTALANSGFVVTNSNYDFQLGLDTDDTSYYLMMRFFDSGGQQTGPARTVFASDDLVNSSRVAQLATGEIVVVWDQDDDAPGVIGDSVYGRIFSSIGQPLSARFEISVDRFNFDDQNEPEIVALAGGGFIVTYTSDSIDADGEGVAGRIYGRGTVGNDVLAVDVTGHMMGLGGNDVLTGNSRANVLDCGAGNDTASGGIGDDRIIGRDGDDRLFGGTGNDVVFGSNGNDRMLGQDGDDLLFGENGNDAMTGSLGRDRFVFNTAPNAVTNVDWITDFTTGQDRLLLDNAVFTALGAAGVLGAGLFKIVGTGGVVDDTDRMIYNQLTGTLSYDADGSGIGAGVTVATLSGAPELTLSDILII